MFKTNFLLHNSLRKSLLFKITNLFFVSISSLSNESRLKKKKHEKKLNLEIKLLKYKTTLLNGSMFLRRNELKIYYIIR